MFKLEEYQSKFKQELFPLAILSAFELWRNFALFPCYTMMHVSIIAPFGKSLVSMCFLIYLFLTANKYEAAINLVYLDVLPNSNILKKIICAIFIVVFHIGFILLWYYNWYSASNVYYVFLYIYCVVAFTLLFRAASRHPNSTDFPN